MVGKLKIHSGDDFFFAEIKALYNKTVEAGMFRYTLGGAECFDIDDRDEISSIEIDELDLSEYNRDTEYSPSVEVYETYIDHHSNCLVIEFS